MQWFVDNGIRGEDLRRLNRVRKAQEALFLSDIATACGRRIEKHFVEMEWRESEDGLQGRHRSTLPYSPEHPTDSDMKLWKRTLHKLAPSLLLMERRLQEWIGPSTRKWRYLWHEESRTIEEHRSHTIVQYRERPDDRAGIYSPSGQSEIPLQDTVPVDVVTRPHDVKLKIKHIGSKLWTTDETGTVSSFWDQLKQLGGEWMWETVDTTIDTSWIVEALARGTLCCATDGSHSSSVALDICSAAWIFYCPVEKKSMCGDLVEVSRDADSYRGEQLGMLAIHLILYTVEKFYGQHNHFANIACDNKGTIQTFSKQYKRVPGSSKNSDILRVLRRIQSESTLHSRLQHVKGHQDDLISHSDLSLAAKLNVDCDHRAKQALRLAHQRRPSLHSHLYILPLEPAAIFIEGEKLTSDLGKALRFHIGKAEAKRFYKDEEIMDNDAFDLVAWEDVKKSLHKKPRMFQLWYSKQCSRTCGTGDRLSKWDPNESGLCPNCGKPESADHLLRCQSSVRRELLLRRVNQIAEWLFQNDTHPQLAAWLPQYILTQGHGNFVSMKHCRGIQMSDEMRTVGEQIDKIGWTHFIEGKLAIAIKHFQHDYLRHSRINVRIDSWMKGLIEQLHIMLHEQWLCRNLCKHHRTQGTKALEAREELQVEIERQLELGYDDLPDHSKCLLDICPDQLFEMPTDRQQYWLNAAQAAREETFLASAKTNTAPTTTNTSQAKTLAPLFTRRPKATSATSTNRERDHASAPTSTTRPRRARTAPVDSIQIRSRCQRQDISDSTIAAILRVDGVNPRYTLQYNGADVVQHSGLKTLQPGIWITDEVINCFLKYVLKPKIDSSRVVLYNSYFFSRLLSDGDYGRGPANYNYSEVRRIAHKYRREGGLLSIPEIYIPINYRCIHWLFLRISPPAKTITIWNSLRGKTYNQTYLAYALRYIGDVYAEHQEQHQNDVDVEAWKRTWTLQDLSESSPEQKNDHDCGIFTLVSITLLAQRFQLTEDTYTQDTIDFNNTRERVAYLLWSTSRNKPKLPRPRQRQRRLTTVSSKAAPPKANKAKQSTKPSLAASVKAKQRAERRKRRRNERIVLGGSRPQGRILSTDSSPLTQLKGIINRKRTAESVAVGQSLVDSSTQRHAPPAKRQKTRRR